MKSFTVELTLSHSKGVITSGGAFHTLSFLFERNHNILEPTMAANSSVSLFFFILAISGHCWCIVDAPQHWSAFLSVIRKVICSFLKFHILWYSYREGMAMPWFMWTFHIFFKCRHGDTPHSPVSPQSKSAELKWSHQIVHRCGWCVCSTRSFCPIPGNSLFCYCCFRGRLPTTMTLQRTSGLTKWMNV